MDPPGSDEPEGESLLSSRDIFGDLVDAPLPRTETTTSRPRTSPIRVQVSDPVLPSAFPAFAEDTDGAGPVARRLRRRSSARPIR